LRQCRYRHGIDSESREFNLRVFKLHAMKELVRKGMARDLLIFGYGRV
jgi:hypothetical protein